MSRRSLLAGVPDHSSLEGYHPYEPRQIVAARARLGAEGLDIRLLPGGHLITAEHPDLLAALIHECVQVWLQS